jgi:hypothetical protein
VAANADSPEAKTIMLLAYPAQISTLRILTLLPPHIAEESDQKMDEFETLMATEDTQVRKSLDGLAALAGLSKDHELAPSRRATLSSVTSGRGSSRYPARIPMSALCPFL